MADQPLNNSNAKNENQISAPMGGASAPSQTPAMERPENIPDPTDAVVDDKSDGTNTHVLDVDTELKGATGAVGFSAVTPTPPPPLVPATQNTPALQPIQAAPQVRMSENPAIPSLLVPPKRMPPPPPPVVPVPTPPTPAPVTLKPTVPQASAVVSLNPEVNSTVQKPPPPPVSVPAVPVPPTQIKQASILQQPRSFASITPLTMREPVAPPSAQIVPPAPPVPKPIPQDPPAPIPPPAARAPQFTPPVSIPQPANVNTPSSPPASPPTDRPTPGMIAPTLPNVRSDPKDAQKRGLFVPPQPMQTPNIQPAQTPAPAPVEKTGPSAIDQLRALTSSAMNPLRTYKGDAEITVKDQNASLITMAAAQQRKRQTIAPSELTENAPKHHYVRTLALALVCVALLAGGVGAIAFVLIPTSVNPPPEVQTSKLVYVDESNELAIGGLDHKALMDLLTQLRDKSGLSLGLVREIYFTLPTETGGKRLATVGEMMPRLAPNVPPELVRALDSHYMVGAHVFDGNQGFIILKTSAYEQAYSAMLEWEPEMLADLSPFMERRLGPKLAKDIRPTSTPARVINSSFVDAIVQNHDARVLYDDVGDIILLYSFIHRDTIVITTNDKTLYQTIVRVTE